MLIYQVHPREARYSPLVPQGPVQDPHFQVPTARSILQRTRRSARDRHAGLVRLVGAEVPVRGWRGRHCSPTAHFRD
jgi:hypothetical protein